MFLMFAIFLVRNMESVIGSDSCELVKVKCIHIKGVYLEGFISVLPMNKDLTTIDLLGFGSDKLIIDIRLGREFLVGWKVSQR
jgi:hypothetical protein